MKSATAPSPPLSAHLKQPLGPILMLDDIREGQMHLAALFIAPNGQELPPIELDGASVPALNLATYQHVTVWRCRFSRPAAGPLHYHWNGCRFDLAGCP
ncbi:MAG: alkaline phosphatase family protein, partial [Pseudomonadota bacterium]|nr:alkaline phosphatase family protein [Pseudomonadota bacterium]